MEIADEPEHQDASPWAWPRWMLGEILALHGDLSGLVTRGLTRRAATMLARFLWSTEAIVRRLLLAAAFALNVAPKDARAPRKPDTKTQSTTEPDDPKPLRPSFRILAIRSAPRAPTQTDDPGRAIVLRPDLGTLPLDPLLRIGAESLPPRISSRSTSRRRGPGKSHAQSYDDWLLHGPWRRDGGAIRPAPKPHSERGPGRTRRRFFEDPPNPFNDPKRRPAGMLARRITALIRVLEKPEAAALRLAHLLARRANLAARFAGLTAPAYRRKEGDKLPRPPGLAELLEAHETFHAARPGPALDTS